MASLKLNKKIILNKTILQFLINCYRNYCKDYKLNDGTELYVLFHTKSMAFDHNFGYISPFFFPTKKEGRRKLE